jgi:diphosphomevalonate decarboxylase
MSEHVSTAIAHPNIALIKYWGNKDQNLRIPVNGSISFNLEGLYTQTFVSFDSAYKADSLSINGNEITGSGLERVVSILDIARALAGKNMFARVESTNNFPIGTGIASSASAFAALSLSASKAIGLDLTEIDLSRLARRGSGSACRSIPGGYVEWFPGESDSDSYAESIAPSNHWDLVDIIAVVSTDHKKVGSTAGHELAASSPLQTARIADSERRLEIARNAILDKDFFTMAEIVELDSNIMHAVMMTSTPPLMYWESTSITIMKTVKDWRFSGLPVCYTLDAGPNVHIITTKENSDKLIANLSEIKGIKKILKSGVGGKTKLMDKN